MNTSMPDSNSSVMNYSLRYDDASLQDMGPPVANSSPLSNQSETIPSIKTINDSIERTVSIAFTKQMTSIKAMFEKESKILRALIPDQTKMAAAIATTVHTQISDELTTKIQTAVDDCLTAQDSRITAKCSEIIDSTIAPTLTNMRLTLSEQNKESVYIQEKIADTQEKIVNIKKQMASLEKDLKHAQSSPPDQPSSQKFNQLLDDLDQQARLSNLIFMGFSTAITVSQFMTVPLLFST